MQIRDTRNGSWYWVNTAVNACPHISPTDKTVYAALCTFSGCAEIRPTFALISQRSAVPIRTCKRSVDTLFDVGYISIKNHGKKGVANVYDLLKAVSGCKKCQTGTSKEVPNPTQEVPNRAGSSATVAPQVDKYIDKELDITAKAVKNENMKNYNQPDLPDRIIDADTGEIEGAADRKNLNQEWNEFVTYWQIECKKAIGIIPEVSIAIDKPTYHRIDKKYNVNEIKSMIDYFLKSPKSREHLTIRSCFSTDSINNWKMHYAKK